MNHYRIILGTILLLFTCLLGELTAQNKYIRGKVVEASSEKNKAPLVGANIYWFGTQQGTSTDLNGEFSLARVSGNPKLVISYLGFPDTTIQVGANQDYLEVAMKSVLSLDEIEILYRRKSTELDYASSMKVEKISEKELLKAACCNLSESFENIPSVDASFTDAVTGTRQIQMLGLAGSYTQINRESMPNIRGLSTLYGLTYIPGTWVESIQLTKGAGSVLNGFESIAGQINVELRKPESAEKVYLNLYGNQMGRLELNANFAHRFKNEKWSSALLLHAKDNSFKFDRNEDGFLDNPLGSQLIALNRWKYAGDQGLRLQFGIKGTWIDNQGGQVDFDPDRDAGTTNHWGMKLNTRRLEGWSKIGMVYEDIPWRSWALQLSGARHEQDSYFGLRDYQAQQNSFYANFIYQSIIGNTNHTFRSGASLQYDDYSERLDAVNFDRQEIVPGAYFEYSHSPSDKFNLVAGLRADYHNWYGLFFTPRLHIRYALTDNTILRVSGGRGQRTANILSENNNLLASARQFIIQGDGSNKPYGLEAEVAWNYGINLTQSFTLDYREGSVSIDFYRTDFQNQIVVDLDQSPQSAIFYNLEGNSYSNSLQVQVDYEILKRVDLRLAYRWFDVQTTLAGSLREKPLISSQRAFANLSYESPKKWKFDLTLNWQGQKRIPITSSNPENLRLESYSPDFFLMNSQVSKAWGKKFEAYLGIENLLNFRQDEPILASEAPFSPYFDSSMVWGPIFGRNVYLGLRYRIK